MGYKVKKIYVGTNLVYPSLKLKQIFDFSTNDWKGYTKVTTYGQGLGIDTTNQCCVSLGTGSNHGDGYIYKEYNASKFWSRTKIKIKSTSNYCGAGCGTFNYYGAGLQCGGGSKIFTLFTGSSTTLDSVSYDFSVNTYYYVDMKFSEGVLTAILLDANLNTLKTLTYNTGSSTYQYGGFYGWTSASNPQSIEIKEYREDYIL